MYKRQIKEIGSTKQEVPIETTAKGSEETTKEGQVTEGVEAKEKEAERLESRQDMPTPWNTASAAAAADPHELQGSCQQEVNAMMGRSSGVRPPIPNKPPEDKEMTAWMANRDKEEKLRIVSERAARLTEHPEEPNSGFHQYKEERAHTVEGRQELSRGTTISWA